tara:strand:+ start:571 stop:1041 length:471 start_codon:yes stop_codon:yes gene_type:complete
MFASLGYGVGPYGTSAAGYGSPLLLGVAAGGGLLTVVGDDGGIRFFVSGVFGAEAHTVFLQPNAGGDMLACYGGVAGRANTIYPEDGGVTFVVPTAVLGDYDIVIQPTSSGIVRVVNAVRVVRRNRRSWTYELASMFPREAFPSRGPMMPTQSEIL